MTDSFTEVTEDTTESTDSDETITDSFTDSVRPHPFYDTPQNNEDRYEDPETGDKADDTDARGLFRPVDLNEIRYYAREGPYGPTIINKPVDDAFKHSFEIKGDNTEGNQNVGKIQETLQEIVPQYKLAKKKSRRDGLAVLMHLVSDGTQSVSDPIQTDDGTFEGFQLWTVDNLSDEITDHEVADNVEKVEPNQVYITEGREDGGVAIVDDISHPDHGEVIGYGIRERGDSESLHDAQFVHADRCHHFVHGEEVDGQLGNNATGEHIGESVLTPILQPLKAAQLGFWSIKEILRRYSAPLHAVEPPESWSMEDYDDAEDKMGDISMASDAVLPPGAELSVAEGVSEFDPEPYYDTLVKPICAGTMFTKSVLEGTQTGSVSGSETDVKGYFSNVNVFRQQEIESDLREIAKKISTYDQSAIPRVASVESVKFDWNPLFKISSLEQAEGAVSLVTAATNGVKNYVLTPDEARSLVEEEWATFDIDVDLDDLTEDQMDTLDRININEAGQGIKDNEPVNSSRTVGGQQGGRPEGSTQSQSNPTVDNSVDELTTEELQAELERREDSE